jgi:hypothetical protein
MSLKYLFPISKANMAQHISIHSLLQTGHHGWNLGAATHGTIVNSSDGTVSTPPYDSISTTEHAAADTTIDEETNSEALAVDTEIAKTLDILRHMHSVIGAHIVEIEANIAARRSKYCLAPITYASTTKEAEFASGLSRRQWEIFYVSELLVAPSTTITTRLRKKPRKRYRHIVEQVAFTNHGG